MNRTSSSRIIIIASILVIVTSVAAKASFSSELLMSLFAANENVGTETSSEQSASIPENIPLSSAMTVPLNAVTSFDYGMVVRHAAGIAPLTTNEQKVAADATGNCNVSSADGAALRQYILGIGAGGTIGTTLPSPGPCPLLPTTATVTRGDASGAPPPTTSGSGTATVSLPNITAPMGTIVVPITVSDLTGLGVLSYDIQVSFDSAIFTPVGTGVSNAGTLSSSMDVATNTANTGHLIISGIMPPLTPLSGSGTLLNLQFNVVDTSGLCSPLTFADWTDAIPRAHQGFLFNEGLPDVVTTNGCVTSGSFTPTNTATATPTNTATPTPTPLPPSCEPFIENFDDAAPPSYEVPYTGDPLYTKALSGSSVGGDVSGNVHENAFILSNFDVITNDQSGTGRFLYHQTVTDGTPSYAGKVWGTVTPVSVFPSTSYVFSFYLTNRSSGGVAQIQPRINNVPIASAVSAIGSFGDGNPAHEWQQFSFVWNSGASPTADLSLWNLQAASGGNDFGIDTIALGLQVACTPTPTPTATATDTPTPTATATTTATATDTPTPTPTPCAQIIENFDGALPPSYAVAYTADPLYTLSGGSSGGNVNGNVHENAFIVSNFANILLDQSGTGRFLYHQTLFDGTPSYAGQVWGTVAPVPVSPNTVYIFSFYLTNRSPGNVAQIEPRITGNVSNFSAPAVSAIGIYGDGNPAHNWQQFCFVWNSGLNTTANLSLWNLQAQSSGNDFGIDTIALGAVCAPCPPTPTPTATATDTPTPTATATTTATATDTPTPTPTPCAQIIENFDGALPPSYAVAYTGDPLYTLSGGSSGGDINGNAFSNAFIVSNFSNILQAQSGGYFLYHQTQAGGAPSYAGKVWGTVGPVTVSPNTPYVFSFYLTNRSATNVAQIELHIDGNVSNFSAPAVSAIGVYDANPANQWQKFTFPWNSGSNTMVDLSLRNLRVTGSGNDFGIDTIVLECTSQGVIDGSIRYGNAIGNPAPPRFVQNVSVASMSGTPAVGQVITGTPGTYSLAGFGSGSYTIKPTKPGGSNTAITSNDAARVAQGVSSSVPFVSLNQKFAADVSGNGTVSSNDAALIARFAAGLAGTGNAGQWKFFTVDIPGPPTAPLPTPPYNDSRTYASVTSSVTGEDYVALLIGEVSGNYNPATHPRPANGPERSMAVQLPRMTASTDKEIIIPVSVQGAADKGIISYEFDLRYDPTVIQPLENPIDVTGTVSRGLLVVTNPNEPGLLRVVLYGPMPIDKDGVLLNLRFRAVGRAGTVSPLIWERIMFNEGDSDTVGTNGQVVIGRLSE